MKKFPFQFVIDTVSLLSVAAFVWWTSHGGLKDKVSELFGKAALHEDDSVRAGHIGDLIFYFAVLDGVVFLILNFLQQVPGRLSKTISAMLPSFSEFEAILMETAQQMVVFLGVYIYLLHLDGAGLKVSKVSLFPFWSLVAMVLHVLGQALAAVVPKPLKFNAASRYLRIAAVGIMLAQIYGYKPFKLI